MNERAKELILSKFDEVMKFRFSINNETDRGCALMAAAYLDEELRKLAERFLVDNESIVNNIFRSDGPLGTFSSRIDLIYLLGLIGPHVRRDLHLIRKIRNVFAHNSNLIDFNQREISDRCNEFTYIFVSKDKEPRRKFLNTVVGLLAVF